MWAKFWRQLIAGNLSTKDVQYKTHFMRKNDNCVLMTVRLSLIILNCVKNFEHVVSLLKI